MPNSAAGSIDHSERVLIVEDKTEGEYFQAFVRLQDPRFEGKGGSITLPLFIDLSKKQALTLTHMTRMMHVHIRKSPRMYIFKLCDIEFHIRQKYINDGRDIMREHDKWIINL